MSEKVTQIQINAAIQVLKGRLQRAKQKIPLAPEMVNARPSYLDDENDYPAHQYGAILSKACRAVLAAHAGWRRAVEEYNNKNRKARIDREKQCEALDLRAAVVEDQLRLAIVTGTPLAEILEKFQ